MRIRPGAEPPVKTRLRHALLGVVVAALVLALIEGVASCGFFVYRWVMSAESPLAERVHTRYDPELGWVSIPGRRSTSPVSAP